MANVNYKFDFAIKEEWRMKDTFSLSLRKIADEFCKDFFARMVEYDDTGNYVKEFADVVTQVDLDNEDSIRKILHVYQKELDLGAIFGEENGYEKIGDGVNVAIVDPIDGTRCFVMEIFYSSVSIGFVDEEGDLKGGILIVINNQKSKKDFTRYETFLVSMGKVWHRVGLEPFVQFEFPKLKSIGLNEACVSLTDVGSYTKQWSENSVHNRDGEKIHRLLKMHSRCGMSFCSGAAEIMSVVSGRLGGFINLGKNSVVSHLVALMIADLNSEISIHHVYDKGNDFSIDLNKLMEKGVSECCFWGGDGSVIVANGSIELATKVKDVVAK